jgi:UDP-N-acetylglucosamine acyltransferase
MPVIHRTAIVESGATLAEDVKIGPFCVVGPHVVLGDGVELISHVAVAGYTTVGEGTRIFPFASIGHAPQDLKYRGEPSRLEIGRRNIIREYATMNPGTVGGGLVTRVGSDCLFMVGAHVAHDCQISDHVIMSNNATLGGHVVLGEYAVLGGLSAVHQYVRIGKHSMIGGVSGVRRDVVPYGQAVGDVARLIGLNIVGLQRRGFSREHIHSLRTAYQMLFGEGGTFAERLDEVTRQFQHIEPVREILEFIRADSARGLCQPQGDNGR